MKVFVIPSWYPSEAFPSTGIFIKEQSEAIAKYRPKWSVGICLWGSHEPKLWVHRSRPLDSLIKLFSKPAIRQYDYMLEPNCVEFFTPANTWSRNIRQGNIEGITRACLANYDRYVKSFGKPDVIHAHVAYPGGEIGRRISQRHNIPLVITEHMSPFPMPTFKRDYKKLLLPPLKYAHKVLTVSEALGLEIAKYGITPQTASNFIDDQFWQSNANSLGDTILMNGRLEDQKGYNLLEPLLNNLVLKKSDFQIRIIGDGSQRKHLNRLSAKFQDHLHCLGECDRFTVKSELDRSKLFLNLSRHENQPVSILEAYAMGVQVISTDWNGAKELVKSEFGEVVTRDVQVITEAILRRLGDPLPRENVRAAYLTYFSTELAVSELEKIYMSVR